MCLKYASISFPTTHFFHPPHYFVNIPNVSNPTLSKFPLFVLGSQHSRTSAERVGCHGVRKKFLCRQNRKEIC